MGRDQQYTVTREIVVAGVMLMVVHVSAVIVHRTDPITKQPLYCHSDQYFECCSHNYSYDTCHQCPTGTYLLDIVKSSELDCYGKTICKTIDCSCTPESVLVNPEKCYKTGVKECQCNLLENQYGPDPNECEFFTGTCDKGYELTQKGTCEECQKGYFKDWKGKGFCKKQTQCIGSDLEVAFQGSSTEDAHCRARNGNNPSKKEVDISVNTENQEKNISSAVFQPMTTERTKTTRGRNDSAENGGITTGYLILILVLVLLFIIVGVCLYGFRQKLGCTERNFINSNSQLVRSLEHLWCWLTGYSFSHRGFQSDHVHYHGVDTKGEVQIVRHFNSETDLKNILTEGHGSTDGHGSSNNNSHLQTVATNNGPTEQRDVSLQVNIVDGSDDSSTMYQASSRIAYDRIPGFSGTDTDRLSDVHNDKCVQFPDVEQKPVLIVQPQRVQTPDRRAEVDVQAVNTTGTSRILLNGAENSIEHGPYERAIDPADIV